MNKLAVVTGGTRGIGRAVIERFAKGGFDIVTSARTRSALESMKDQLQKNYNVKVDVLSADLSQASQVKEFGQFVTGLHRPVDVLVNNAGFFTPGSIITEVDGALEQMIQANLYSAYHLTRCLVPAMKERRSGHIFNMCSIASTKAYPNGGSYAISKHALLGFSRVLREELKQYDIRVTAVMPGATKTDSWAGVDLPDSRFMKTEDVAEAIFAAHALSVNSVVEEMIIRPQLGDI